MICKHGLGFWLFDFQSFLRVGCDHARFGRRFVHSIFDLLPSRQSRSRPAKRPPTRRSLRPPPARFRCTRQSLLARSCACGEIHKPQVIPAVHKPVGKVVNAGQDTDEIKGRPNPSLHRGDQRAGGVVRSKRCKPELADAGQPKLRVKPTMQMQDVKEQIDQGDESGPTLPAVATVAGEAILAGCWTFRSWQSKHQSQRERSGGENESPFDQRQQLARTVDHVNRPLKGFRGVQKAGVGRQVNHHVKPERHNPQQGVEPSDREFMSQQEAGLGGERRGSS